MATATPADVDDAFAAAGRAEPVLRETTVVRRAEWLSAVAERHRGAGREREGAFGHAAVPPKYATPS